MHKQNRHYSLREAEYEKNYHIKQSAYINSNQFAWVKIASRRQRHKRDNVCVFLAGGRAGCGTARNANICHFRDKGNCVEHVGSGCYRVHWASKYFLQENTKGNSTPTKASTGATCAPAVKHTYHITSRPHFD